MFATGDGKGMADDDVFETLVSWAFVDDEDVAGTFVPCVPLKKFQPMGLNAKAEARIAMIATTPTLFFPIIILCFTSNI
jgi:hypothetical protein